MKGIIYSLAIAGLVLASCSDGESDIAVKSHFEQVIGEFDAAQTWKTTNGASISVKVPADGVVAVSCEDDNEKVCLTSVRVTAGQKTIEFSIPQHLALEIETYGLDEDENSIVTGTTSRVLAVEYKKDGLTEVKRISMENALKGIFVDFCDSEIKNAPRRAASDTKAVNEAPKKDALTCKVNTKLYGYSTFTGDILEELSKALPENKVAKDQINNFEMYSNGRFLVSMIYGCTGNSSREVGYYYYDKNNPTDVTYVPFCDALAYDYLYDDIDYTKDQAISKTQVKINGQWNDVNYEHWDRTASSYSSKIRIASHKNDAVYTILDVFERQKNDIEEVRGATFEVDAPKGSVVGFYCSGKDSKYQSGKEVFLNHCDKSMNTYNKGQVYTACIRIYNGYRFIGLEDGYHTSTKGNEPDCNDIAFAMVPGGNLPDIRMPYIYDNNKEMYYNGDATWTATPKKDVLTDGVYTEDVATTTDDYYAALANGKLAWTMAFEDMGVRGDFDFNDVVIRIVPLPEVKKAQVQICAVGASNDAALYYGNQYLGEAHDLLGVSRGSMANTGAGTQSVPYKIIAYVDWDENKTLEKNASDFYIFSNGLKTTVPTVAGEIPGAICVSYNWRWPVEKTNVSKAYLQFGKWGANYGNKNYWNWYTLPVEDYVK